MDSQGLLFSEPSIAETGVWCQLSEGINPAQWAALCRFIGTKRPHEFETITRMVKGGKVTHSPLAEKPKNVKMPLVSIGPSGIGGPYQREWFG
ncbi:MAG: hypothetical protein ACYSTT_18350 [Planctomycetota bacterium]|jgi:hypothetical protein